MKRLLYIYLLLISAFLPEVYGQNITFDKPHPITSAELLNPWCPVVLKNGSKAYFVTHVYSEQANYGGLLSKEWFTLDPQLLYFYENTTLFHLNIQKQSAIIGTDTASQITYYTNSRFQNSRFEGLFSTESYQASRAKKISIPGFDAGDIHSFYLSPAWDILIFSMQRKGGVGREDMYVSTSENGVWKKPLHLGATINTEGGEISPFLSSDKKKLFFSSDGHGGYGSSDLFVAERLYNSWQVWSQPVNLGEKINSSGYDAYLSIMDDSIAYFFSETNGQGKLWRAGVATPSQHMRFRQAIDTRRYLEKEEVEAWLGFAIDTTLSFNPNELSLAQNGRELLWFIANQMISTPEIHINFTFLPHSGNDQLTAKSIIVRNYLTLLGINENRISTHALPTREALPELKVDAVFNFFRRK